MEKRVTVLLCDEPIGSRGNQPCERPATGVPVTMFFGDVMREKDLCEMHLERYKLGSRVKVKKNA